ncbi:MAG: ATP-binding protein [Terricaulis sp.]
MARGELIKKLFASRGRDEEFRSVAELIIGEEERKGNVALARSLRKVLGAETSAPPAKGPKGLAPLIPFPDAAADLVERIEPSHVAADVVLSRQNVAIFKGLLDEFRRAEDIQRKGLPVRSRLLFCGPPGTGKTLTAEVFAAELKLPLFVVKLDRLMSSYLGETATNVRKVFEFARKQPSVVFLDEFDALARARDDTSEHSELRRVVNSLLLFIERIKPNGFLVAATNLESSLDEAVYRRFDEVVWFDLPTKAQITQFVKRKFRNVEMTFDPVAYVDAMVDYSLAEIERACIQAIKAPIIARRAKVEVADMRAAIADMARRRKGMKRLKPSS